MTPIKIQPRTLERALALALAAILIGALAAALWSAAMPTGAGAWGCHKCPPPTTTSTTVPETTTTTTEAPTTTTTTEAPPTTSTTVPETTTTTWITIHEPPQFDPPTADHEQPAPGPATDPRPLLPVTGPSTVDKAVGAGLAIVALGAALGGIQAYDRRHGHQPPAGEEAPIRTAGSR